MAPPHTRADVPDVAVGGLAAAAVLGLSWALSGAAGSAGLPRTDDWAFARVAVELHRSGAFHLVGWGEMSLVGLAVWAQPWLWAFGDHQWALDLAGGALVGAGIVAGYLLARRALSRPGAVVVVLSVALFPGFLRDASSFMTDGPAFGVQAACLLAGVAALGAGGRRRTVLSWTALALGVFAFAIRELAVAAPLAVLAAEAGSPDRRLRSLLARAGALAAGCGAIWWWHRSLPGTQPWFGRPPWLTGSAFVVAAGITTALGLLPALVWSLPRWWRARRRWARTGGMVLGLVACAVLPWYVHDAHVGTVWFVGDYLGRFGMNGDKLLAGMRPSLVPGAPWTLLEVAAVGAFVVVCGLLAEAAAVRLHRRGDDVATRATTAGADAGRTRTLHALRWFAALTGAGLVVATVLNGVLFDRYLWPLVFAGAVLVMAQPAATAPAVAQTPAAIVDPTVSRRRAPRRAHAVAGVVLAGFAALGVAFAANSDAFDAARWRAGQRLVASGIPAGRVDAGFEWVGAHTTATADIHAARISPERSWWVSMFGLPVSCGVVAASATAPRGYVEVGTLSWRPELAWGHAELVLYRAPGCPAVR